MKKLLFFIIAFITLTTYADPAAMITDYHATFIPGYDAEGNTQIAIRMYYNNNKPYFLLVNPANLTTKIEAVVDFKSRAPNTNSSGYYTMAELEKTPYLKALLQYSSSPYLLQNYGLTKAEHAIDGMFLTIDMCPSKKPFEKDFFNTLVSLSEKSQQPIPIALSMSGLWMTGHPEEFDWLISQAKNNKLAITWINHSFSHVYYADLPFDKNFMLNHTSDFEQEILETEKILLQKEQIPSVFFRFPGLVADKELILKLRALGLIPVGSNAWLAKKETPKAGSIILVHGNSNEHAGIEKVMPLLQQPGLKLLPLSEALLTYERRSG